MLAYIRKPHNDLAALILRVGLGYLFIGYGYIKIYQDFPLSEFMSESTQTAVGWVELICGVLLVLGLLTRLASLVVITDMAAAIYLVTGRRGFFGMGADPHGETFRPGFEYNVVIILVCLALLALGSGRFSLDQLIFNRKKKETIGGEPAPQAPSVAPAPVVKA
jgi:putative oxidoreductase